MLIQFSVENYKTFKKRNVLSMVASNYFLENEENKIVSDNLNYSLLKSAVIYGANASGKSKLFDALSFMKNFIRNSSKESQAKETIGTDSFRLNTESRLCNSEFEVLFVHENVHYRYGFEVSKEKVHAEWLYYKPKTKEVELFYRENQDFSQIHERDFKKGKLISKEGLVRENALLLSVSAQFNDPVATQVLDWFNKLNIISGIQEKGYSGYSFQMLEDSESKQKILDFIKIADLGIEDITKEPVDESEIGLDVINKLKLSLKDKEGILENFKIFNLMTHHLIFDEQNQRQNNLAQFSMEGDESSGTNKYFALSGPIIDTLENGKVLFIDELDAKLHPLLVLKIIDLFNNKETNRNNAQLVFNTHDTNLLKHSNFRRDQIWFAEKNMYGAVTLYSLADFITDDGKKIRKEEDFEKNYIEGKYGAIPFLGDFSKIIN